MTPLNSVKLKKNYLRFNFKLIYWAIYTDFLIRPILWLLLMDNISIQTNGFDIDYINGWYKWLIFLEVPKESEFVKFGMFPQNFLLSVNILRFAKF